MAPGNRSAEAGAALRSLGSQLCDQATSGPPQVPAGSSQPELACSPPPGKVCGLLSQLGPGLTKGSAPESPPSDKGSHICVTA